MDNTKEIADMGKKLKSWTHRALTVERKVQELRDEFNKQGKDCLNIGSMGENLVLSYLMTSPTILTKHWKPTRMRNNKRMCLKFSLAFFFQTFLYFFVCNFETIRMK